MKKKRNKGHAKGSAFERSICRQLSLWWSNGKRDDIFWRTANSGGRATVRNKSGKSSVGEGDIGAIHQLGHSLLKHFTFELKCGYKGASPYDLVDMPKKSKQRLWEEWITKAAKIAEETDTSWIIIAKRDRRKIVMAMETWLANKLGLDEKLKIQIKELTISFCLLSNFLKVVDGKQLKITLRAPKGAS